MKSINDLGLITPEISTIALAIFNKIAFINSNIMNTIAIPNKKNKIIYLSQITEDWVKSLLKA